MQIDSFVINAAKLQDIAYLFTRRLNSTPITMSPTQTQLVMSGLQPYTYYNIIIATVLLDGVFFSQSFVYRTAAAPPDRSPTNIGLYKAAQPTSLFISFTPATTSGNGLYFAVEQTDLVTNSTIVFNGTFGENIGPAANTRVPSQICQDGIMVLFANSLFPNTPYRFRLAQATEDGVVSLTFQFSVLCVFQYCHDAVMYYDHQCSLAHYNMPER